MGFALRCGGVVSGILAVYGRKRWKRPDCLLVALCGAVIKKEIKKKINVKFDR